MGDVARALAVGPDIDFEGRTYTLSPLTYELQAKFEVWLERRAVQAVERQKPYLADDDFRERSARVFVDIAAGVYSFGSPASVQAAGTLPGLKELMRLSLSKKHPDVDAAFVDRLVEAKQKEVGEAFQRANAGPLPSPPPPAAGGG